ncbi:MAG: murein biosynthesis integral membrane protein MurJ [Chloroflexi bacterium]|nr:murein biosynthesis integral membrane protein MurJ [Chloroflexota bacterium]
MRGPQEQDSEPRGDALGAGVGRAAAIVVASILVSRVLGFVRQAAINAEFGVGPEADAWFAAFRIPDTIFMLLAGGALLSAVIPVYAEVKARGDPQALGRFVGRIGALVAGASAVLAGISALLAEPLMRVVAPGFPDATVALATDAARWLMISPVVLAMSAVAKAALQAERRFALPALSPLLYNLGIIAGALGLARVFGLTGLVWGTLIGTGLHLLVQTPGLPAIFGAGEATARRFNYKSWHPGAAWADPDVRKVIRLMVPRMLGVAVLQASLIYINILASLQGPSAVAVLNNAFLLMLLPLGVFGMALGEATLPDLAHRWISGDRAAFARRVHGVGRIVLFLSVPAAVVLAVLAEPIVSVAFERHAFDARATELTANALRFYAVGLAGHAAVEVLVRGFFAMHDTRTPVAVGAGSLALHMVLSWAFSVVMGNPGIALGLSIGVLVEAVILVAILRRRGGVVVQGDDARWALGIVLAAALMGAAIGGLRLATWPAADALAGGGWLAAYLATALVVYVGAARLMRSPELNELVGQITGRLRRAAR